MTDSPIHMNWIGNNRFEFSFEGRAGKLTGRVSVATMDNAQDIRSTQERGAAARKLVDAMAAEFLAASKAGRYAGGG